MFAQRPNSQAPAADAPQQGGAEAPGLPIPPEEAIKTQHEWKTIHYTATAGNLLINGEDNKPISSIFYVAYTADGAKSEDRPVTFFYNGGPGSATIWLHMGSFSPVRVETDSPKATRPAPHPWVTNEYSLIDKSDLVLAVLVGLDDQVGDDVLRALGDVLRARSRVEPPEVLDRFLDLVDRDPGLLLDRRQTVLLDVVEVA